MLDFRSTKISDRRWVLPLLEGACIPLCDYSFTTLYCWQNIYGQEICHHQGFLLVHVNSAFGEGYLWPVGSGDLAQAFRALEEDAAQRGEPLRIIAVLDEKRPCLEELFPGRIQWIDNRDNYDYLYDVNRLADLPGKKLHAKRNHIHRFHDLCPSWRFEALTPEDIPDCLRLDDLWYEDYLTRSSGEDALSVAQERSAMRIALENFVDLGLDGGLLRCDNSLLAYCLGSRITPEVYDIHFERARVDIQGAFPAINQEFAKWIRAHHPEVRYLNREEDLGHPGLRKAKLSYIPDLLVENFCAVIAAGAE